MTKSCSLATVITANGEACRRTEEAHHVLRHQTTNVKELGIFLTMILQSSKTNQQYCRLESFAMKTDILMNGSMVKKHISLKTRFEYNATRRTSFLSWYQACQIRLLDLHQLQGLSRQESHYSTSSSCSSSSPTVTSSDNETREREDRIVSDTSPEPVSTNIDDRSGQPVVDQANQIQNQIKRNPR